MGILLVVQRLKGNVKEERKNKSPAFTCVPALAKSVLLKTMEDENLKVMTTVQLNAFLL